MPPVKIYTAMLCPYCHMAKAILHAKGVTFDEVDVTGKPAERAEMTQRASGRRTVPQIWIGSTHVGGYDELRALDRDGRLDPLLASATA